MLDYEWGNPSTIIFSGDESTQEADQNRQLFDPYAPQTFGEATAAFLNPNAHYSPASAAAATHHHHTSYPFHQEHSGSAHLNSLFDPRAAAYGASSYNPQHHASMLSLEPAGPTGFMVVPKSEPVVGGVDFAAAGSNSRIGLNLGLGGRTYFSSSEDDFLNRLYRRPRVVEPGSVNFPRCQAEGCNADLTNAKHYHRRHKVCEFHSKAATVVAAGLTQRFCQQCSRFHLLSEFDNGKRSCRKRLADHNRRRRKSQQQQQQQPNQEQCNNNKSSNDNARSPPESGAHSSTVTVAISPPRISLDCFRQRSAYQAGATTANSSASTNSVFFSDG